MTLARGLIRPYDVIGSPVRRPTGGRKTLSTRPQNFLSWWAWGVDQASAVQRMGRGGTWLGHLAAAFAPKIENPKAPKHHREDIVKTAVPGQVTAKAPMLDAMQRLVNPRGSHPHEYRILFALTNGHTDPEIVRAIVGGCRRDFFEAAAIRALALVWDRASEMLGGVT